MTTAELAVIAETIREGRGYYASNTGHAQHASDVAQGLAAIVPDFDRAAFILDAMPRAWVGTSKANPWERIARGDRY